MPHDLITAAQAATILDVKPTALYYKFKIGALPMLRFPNGKLATTLSAATRLAALSKAKVWQHDCLLTGGTDSHRYR